MRWLDECVGATDVGRKAETLARLRREGFRVLDGFVILPNEVVATDALASALERLGGGAFAVRSSSSVEDAAGASAAGVFESIIGARGVDGVHAAIERVRQSATAEPARAYLQARGLAATVSMSVLVQPVVNAPMLAVARSLDGGGFLVEERRAGEPEWGDVQAHTLAPDDHRELAETLRRIEALLAAPVDVELALGPDQVTILQARPRVHAAVVDVQPALAGDWRLDAEHNPEPLSLAQAGLVAHVEQLQVGHEQRVVDGWLYVSRAPARNLHPIPLAELRRRFDEEVAPDCLARLAAVEDGHSLDDALEVYAHVFRRYVAEVGPSLRRAREQLDQLLRLNVGESLAQNGSLLAGLGGLTVERDQQLWELGRAAAHEWPAGYRRYCERFGAFAPAWDVMVAPDDEAEARVQAVAARAGAEARSPLERHAAAKADADAAMHATLERLDRMARRAFKALLPLVRDALPIAEDDDLLFFRAQRAARRALLARARSLGLADLNDVFELPLDVVRSSIDASSGSARSALGDAAALASLAAKNRSARLAAARRVPPLAIDGGQARQVEPSSRAVWRGHPTQGRARGRAVVLRSPASAPPELPDDAILVVPAILPSLAYLLPFARALVTEHGGATSHGATLAREYGVPAVLGIGAAPALVDGVELFVDGSAGRVYLL